MAPKATSRIERERWIELSRKGVPAAEVAALYGVTPKTIYKWLARHRNEGDERGLEERSSARHTQKRFRGRALKLLIALRKKRPSWGPRKLLHWLKLNQPNLKAPAASTLHDHLKKLNLVTPRRRHRRHQSHFVAGTTIAMEPNDRWTIDFKGHFRMLDGNICYPLTIRDDATRMMLVIHACADEKGSTVIPILRAAFEEYGLPKELHSDNGTPFGSSGFAGLSEISFFALEQGVLPVFSRPSKPQDNGGHERMHRDLKLEATRPPGRNLRQQQKRFDVWREHFNFERPHESLGGHLPGSWWHPSERVFSAEPKSIVYPKHWEHRIVDKNGEINLRGHDVFVAGALRGLKIGLEPIDEQRWRMHYGNLLIGLLFESDFKVQFFSREQQTLRSRLSPT